MKELLLGLGIPAGLILLAWGFYTLTYQWYPADVAGDIVGIAVVFGLGGFVAGAYAGSKK